MKLILHFESENDKKDREVSVDSIGKFLFFIERLKNNGIVTNGMQYRFNGQVIPVGSHKTITDLGLTEGSTLNVKPGGYKKHVRTMKINLHFDSEKDKDKEDQEVSIALSIQFASFVRWVENTLIGTGSKQYKHGGTVIPSRSTKTITEVGLNEGSTLTIQSGTVSLVGLHVDNFKRQFIEIKFNSYEDYQKYHKSLQESLFTSAATWVN
jgi:hypothetical protein